MTSHFLPLVFPVTRPEARSHQRSGCDQVSPQRRCVWSTCFKVFCCQHWLDGRSHRNTDYQLLLCPPLCACEVKGRALSRGPQGRFSVGKASRRTDAKGNEVATGGWGGGRGRNTPDPSLRIGLPHSGAAPATETHCPAAVDAASPKSGASRRALGLRASLRAAGRPAALSPSARLRFPDGARPAPARPPLTSGRIHVHQPRVPGRPQPAALRATQHSSERPARLAPCPFRSLGFPRGSFSDSLYPR